MFEISFSDRSVHYVFSMVYPVSLEQETKTNKTKDNHRLFFYIFSGQCGNGQITVKCRKNKSY